MPLGLHPDMYGLLNHPLPVWCRFPFFRSPLGTVVGVPASPEFLMLHDVLAGSYRARGLVRIPPAGEEVAIDGAQDRIAVVQRDRVEVREAPDRLVAARGFDGRIRGACFDPSGALLCVGVESGHRDPPNSLVLVDSESLDTLLEQPLSGEEESAHYFHWHPTDNLVAIQVACGQDGVWNHLLRIDGPRVETLSIAAPPTPAVTFAGFTSDGRLLAGTSQSTARLWSVRTGWEVARYEFPEGTVPESCANLGTHGWCVPVFVHDREHFVVSILETGQGLTLRAMLPLEEDDPRLPTAGKAGVEYLWAAPGDLVVAVGSEYTSPCSPADRKPTTLHRMWWRIADR